MTNEQETMADIVREMRGHAKDGEISCPYYGEPNGCNNRECAEVYKMLYKEAK